MLKRRLMWFIVGAAGVVLVFVWGSRDTDALLPQAFPPNPPSAGAPDIHVYGNPSVSLRDIDVRVVYFLPKGGSRERGDVQFQEVLSYLNTSVVPEMRAFHEKEWRGHSGLQFRVLPTIFYGLQEGAVYEKDFLIISAQNPLAVIERELRQRLFVETGDLFDQEFAERKTSSYRILLIIYGGSAPRWAGTEAETFVAGLTGDIGTSALVFRQFLDPNLAVLFPNAATVVYHELLHTMGVPELYNLHSTDVVREQARRKDVMGQGVLKPLQTTFIGNDVKAGMGLTAL